MKITEKLRQAEKEDRIWWSFEYFPPRTPQGLQNLYDRISRMRELGPEFVDITWSAGGRSMDLTTSLIQVCQKDIGVETCMHITCVSKDKLDQALDLAKKYGCRNILALRGDPEAGSNVWVKEENGFDNAIELVRYIRERYGDAFCISVAAFPGGHCEMEDCITGSSNEKEASDLEIQLLKEKVDAGADFIFTQMFYSAPLFLSWLKRVRAAGISVPVVPGIMPIQSYATFQKWVSREAITVPQHFYDALEPVKDDDEKVREVGTKLVAQMCRDILTAPGADIKGLHVYTLNLAVGARLLLEELGCIPTKSQVNPLPWTPSLTPGRRQESIRPIFWANRQQSYISRSEEWNEFPNGRWGDARSPAFGDFHHSLISFPPSKATPAQWGTPTSLSDITSLFSRFCHGDLSSLPWSEGAPSKETAVISPELVKMNQKGYLTINSQPAVDGAKSDDSVFGWGPKGGYVYQKAYLEFFVAPEALASLVERIVADPMMTYYAVNQAGVLQTNNQSEDPNAVTWGIFPNKEVLQPTIVEQMSFMAWKDEAYQIGHQWATLYPAESESRAVIEQMMREWVLVNVVHNDFKAPGAIFKPFLLDEPLANGH